MKNYFDFETEAKPTIAQVGGKAESLINLTKGGFNVPAGNVLSVAFFSEWINELQNISDVHDKWTDPDQFRILSTQLKDYAKDFIYSEQQKSTVLAILRSLGEHDRFAVRSSSPEEDLAGASFAGGYETILGVNKETIFDAIKTAFISCLDERVFYYKDHNGFDTSVLRIAVIIQKQIDSDISGVGFSLNPLNNCFDEIVINSNTGLGESVVSGMITPDEFVVDKHNEKILNRTLGSKEKSIVLDENSGTKVVNGTERFSISDQKVVELSNIIQEIESFYGFPVDIEWAFKSNELYILQSRPITTYVPLPTEMQTKPGEKRILYLDGSLVKQGITTPISVLGIDCLRATQAAMFDDMMGKDVSSDVKGGIGTTRGGRMYINVSTGLKFQGEKRFMNTWNMVDVSTVDLLKSIDLLPYKPDKLPHAMKGAMWGAIKNNIGTLSLTRKAMKDPDGYKKWYGPYESEFESYLAEIKKKNVRIIDIPTLIIEKYIELLKLMLPMTYAAEISRKKIASLLKANMDDAEVKMQFLERSLPNNVTIDMGMEMYTLSQMKEIKENSFEDFNNLIKNNAFSEKFKLKWEAYIKQYGCRTHNELDIGVARTSENRLELFNQIKAMAVVEDDYNPKSIYENSKKQRQDTYQEILSNLSENKNMKMIKKLEKHYNVLVTLGGRREALKYWYVRSLTTIREIILEEAKLLVQQDKLSTVEDVFWLNLKQIDTLKGLDNSHKLELREIKEIIESNRNFYDQLNQVKQFPKLINSRGEILTRPILEAKEGELAGQPISPGIITGRVKVLATPDEKPLLPGEIMVTRATDPGWTPLFINASAILLEVGGLLQHGALVAREYGKPCIAGLEGVMERLQDGQLIEVNATQGIVKIIE